MTQIEPDDQEEKPLDPAMENVRRKMVRLQIVSGAIMFVSLMAVFGAVVYKVTRTEPAGGAQSSAAGVPSDSPVTSRVSLPLGFQVQSTSLSGSQVLFFGQAVDGRTLKELGVASTPDRSFTLRRTDTVASIRAAHRARCATSTTCAGKRPSASSRPTRRSPTRARCPIRCSPSRCSRSS